MIDPALRFEALAEMSRIRLELRELETAAPSSSVIDRHVTRLQQRLTTFEVTVLGWYGIRRT
jgi:hypothetical protein